MAKFLICVWPFPGHYFPVLAIAHALRERQHEVAFYTGAQAGPAIEGEGFRWFPFRAIDEEAFAAMIVDRERFASSRQPAQMRALLQQWLLGTLDGQVADISAALAAWQPDVVVTETAMWGPSLILHETHKVPVAVFSTVAACMLPGPDAPPFGVGLPRPRTWRARLLARSATRVINWFAAGFRQAANDQRAQYGLPPLRVSVTEHCGTLPLYLMPSTPEFDYDRADLPPSVHYIGPCIWNRPQTEPPPPWLATTPHDQPWVHVSEGTVNSQQPFVLRAAAQGLGNQPMHVIMTTGGNRDPDTLDLGPIAPNIRLVRWIAHSDLLPQTDVLVTTGGAGTVIAALCAGVPLVIVPTEWDKPENAQRVVEAGVGVRLRLRHCTPERLRDAVRHVLDDPAYRRNAQALGERLRGYDGPRQAAALLEALNPHAVEPRDAVGVAG